MTTAVVGGTSTPYDTGTLSTASLHVKSLWFSLGRYTFRHHHHGGCLTACCMALCRVNGPLTLSSTIATRFFGGVSYGRNTAVVLIPLHLLKKIAVVWIWRRFLESRLSLSHRLAAGAVYDVQSRAEEGVFPYFWRLRRRFHCDPSAVCSVNVVGCRRRTAFWGNMVSGWWQTVMKGCDDNLMECRSIDRGGTVRPTTDPYRVTLAHERSQAWSTTIPTVKYENHGVKSHLNRPHPVL